MKSSCQWAEAYMGVQNIGKEDFQQTVAKGGILFIDWWAPWWGPCRAFARVYEKVAETNPDATFAKINTDEEQELAAAFNIRSIPTLMIFRDKVLLFAPGWANSSTLSRKIMSVGMLRMLNAAASSCSSSVLIFAKVASGLVSATFSYTRANARQGPHQGAHQSMNRMPPFATVCWKSSLPMFCTPMYASAHWQEDFILPAALRYGPGPRSSPAPGPSRGRAWSSSPGARRTKAALP